MINNLLRLCLTRNEHKIKSVISNVDWSKNMCVTYANSSRIQIESVAVLSRLIMVVTGPATSSYFVGIQHVA